MKTIKLIRIIAVNLLLAAAFCLLAAVLVRPLLAELSFGSGQSLAGAFKWAEAEGKFEKAIRLDPFSSAYACGYAEFLRLSSRYSYDKAGLLKKAIGLYDRAIELEPENSEYFLKRGLAKINAGKPVNGAFEDLWEACQRDPNGYNAAYSTGYTGMNIWKFLDGRNRNFVTERLAYAIKVAPWQAQKAYEAAWKAAKDFSILKKLTPDTPQGRLGLYNFMAAHNLWQFRKEAARPEKDMKLIMETVRKIKAKIIEDEKLAEANAWTMIDGKWQMAKGGEAIVERNKAANERRARGVVAPEDWIAVSKDIKKTRHSKGSVYSNGAIYALIDVPGGRSTVKIEAKGSAAGGIWPYMIVELDGEEIGGVFADSAEFKEYEFSLDAAGGTKLLGISFVNDGSDKGKNEDRNLFVGNARITGSL